MLAEAELDFEFEDLPCHTVILPCRAPNPVAMRVAEGRRPAVGAHARVWDLSICAQRCSVIFTGAV